MSRKLWSIFVPGPDEHYAAPSEAAAKQMAEKHNAAMAAYFAKHPSTEFGPSPESCLASITEWPFEADDHAEEIASFDYAQWGIEGGDQ